MIREQRSTSVNLVSYPNLEPANSWNDSNINDFNDNFGYKIKLNNEKLIVKRTCKTSQMHLLSHRSAAFLAEWLQFSPATIVEIDSAIELEKLEIWANQCQRYRKKIFLRLFQQNKFYQPDQIDHYQIIKRCCDILGALILLIIFSPILIAIAILIQIYSQEPILRSQWCVGKQGKLFCIYQFGGNLKRIKLGRLHKLPLLLNVFQGDMSLIGRFPWSLTEAIKINSAEKYDLNLNDLPGIIEAWGFEKIRNT